MDTPAPPLDHRFTSGREGLAPVSYGDLDPTEQEAILQLQQSLLEAVALGQERKAIFDRLCQLEERLLPGAVASVMLLDGEVLNVFSAPTLPAEGVAMLNGLRPGPTGGSCGNVVYRQQPVFVADTLNDPRWGDLRPLAERLGVRACWSMPIRGPGGRVVGSFALSLFNHGLPSPFHRKLLEIGASIIGIVLERHRETEALRASEARYRQMFEINQAVKLLIDPHDGRLVDANSAAAAYYGYAPDSLRRLTLQDLSPELDRAQWAAGLERMGAEAAPQRRDCRHRLASGEMREVEVYSGPVTVGERTLLYTIVHDVTARSRAEESLRRERDFVNAVFDTMASLVVVMDRQGAIVRFNRAAEAFTGFDGEEVSGIPFLWERFLPEDERAHVREAFNHMMQGHLIARHESRWKRADGSYRLLDWANTRLRGEDGGVDYLVSIGTDITERRQAEDGLKLAASVFENTREGIAITDVSGTIVDINRAFSDVTGYGRDEVLGQNPRLLKSGRHDPGFYHAMWETLRQNGHWSGEIWNRRKSGEIYPEWLTISAVRDRLGEVNRYVAVFTDISVIKRQQQALERLAHYDVLTGLPNRALLADRMGQAIHHSRRANRLLAVAYVDLDEFKPVNDTYGHEAGDQVLAEIARRLEGALRGEDTVARVGGDEFVVLLPGISSAAECDIALARVRTAIGRPVPLRGREETVTVSASIGVSFYPSDATDPEALIQMADRAMYRAKQGGEGSAAPENGA